MRNYFEGIVEITIASTGKEGDGMIGGKIANWMVVIVAHEIRE